MTITIDVPPEAELRLKQEADREGFPVERLVERVIAERFDATALGGTENAQTFFDRMARPSAVIDTSRDNIHANT